MKPSFNLPMIDALEVANYVVCPQAWALKRRSTSQGVPVSSAHQHGTVETRSAREDWVSNQQLSSTLHGYTRALLLLLGILVVVLIALDANRFVQEGVSRFQSFRRGASVSNETTAESTVPLSTPRNGQLHHFAIPNEIYLLLLLVGALILILDLFLRKRVSIQHKAGLESRSHVISMRSGGQTDQTALTSEILGLTAKPDAIVKEHGAVIPVLVKPSTQKVRDRHVVELLVSLRLLDEQEGTTTPYGLLLMGKTKKRIVLKNTEEKQRWLTALLAEMRSILEQNVPPLPTPKFEKCKHCDVRSLCDYSAYKEREI